MPESLWNSFRSCVAVRYFGRCAFGNIFTYRRMTDWLQHYEGMKEDKMSKYDPLWKYVSAAAFWKRCMRNSLCPRRKSHEQKMCCQSRNNTQDTAITVAALLLGFFTRILCRRTGSAPLSDAMARLVYFCNAYREKALWYRKKAYGTADDGRAEAGICGGRLLLRIPSSVIRISSDPEQSNWMSATVTTLDDKIVPYILFATGQLCSIWNCKKSSVVLYSKSIGERRVDLILCSQINLPSNLDIQVFRKDTLLLAGSCGIWNRSIMWRHPIPDSCRRSFKLIG